MPFHNIDAATAERRARDAEAAATLARRKQDANTASTSLRRLQDANTAATAARRAQDANTAATAARRQQDADTAATAARRAQDQEAIRTLQRRREFAATATAVARQRQLAQQRATALRRTQFAASDAARERERLMLLGSGIATERVPRRDFVHKKLLKIAGLSGIPVISQIGQIGTSIFDRRGTPRIPLPTLPGIIPGLGGDGQPCRPPLVRGPAGNCLFPGSPVGEGMLGGTAVMGQFGAGVAATSRIVDVAQCPRKHVLGADGICYRGLKNSDRMYPKGRRPLLTGGDLNAITKAGNAATRLNNQRKRLEKLGLLKKPATRTRLPPHQHQVKVT